MKNNIRFILFFLIIPGLILSTYFLLKPQAGLSLELDPGSTPINCETYWWFDRDNLECRQKDFCGLFYYSGLQIFTEKENCEENLEYFSKLSEPSKKRASNFEQTREQIISGVQERTRYFKEYAGESRKDEIGLSKERYSAFQDKIGQIKDEALRNRVKKLAQNINRVNQNLCNRHFMVLNALDIITAKIESRIDKIEQTGDYDTADIYKHLNEIKIAINELRIIAADQKNEIYSIENFSEQMLDWSFNSIFEEMKEAHLMIVWEIQDYLLWDIKEILINISGLTAN